jgi:hypothetical protein
LVGWGALEEAGTAVGGSWGDTEGSSGAGRKVPFVKHPSLRLYGGAGKVNDLLRQPRLQEGTRVTQIADIMNLSLLLF